MSPNSFISSVTLPTTHTPNSLTQTSPHSRPQLGTAGTRWHTAGTQFCFTMREHPLLKTSCLQLRSQPQKIGPACPGPPPLGTSQTLPATDKEAAEGSGQIQSQCLNLFFQSRKSQATQAPRRGQPQKRRNQSGRKLPAASRGRGAALRGNN